MQIETLQNLLLKAAINPAVKHIIRVMDRECPRDGSLLLNSLRSFLGEESRLCPACKKVNDKVSRPFYMIGCKILRIDPKFMKNQFFNDKYGEAWLRGFGLMMKGIEENGAVIPFTPAGPFEIVWNVTYQCNLRCKHCYENAGNTRPELSTEEAKQAIDAMSEIAGIGLPALSFSGGEPLARKDFFELAEYARKRIGYLSIASNGTLITLDNARKLRDIGIDYAEISIDGMSPHVHDDFRGVPGALERALHGIRNCLDAGIDTCIATVLHRDNLKELPKLLEFSKKEDLRFMHFNYIPTGRAREWVELDLTPDQRYGVLETLGKEIITLYMQRKIEEKRCGRSSVKVDRFFSTCPQYASVTKEISKRRGENFIVEAHYAAKKGVEGVASFLGGCGAGRLYCCMEPNGDVKPCVFFPTNQGTVLGNILRDDFQEIWNHNSFLRRLRSREKLEQFIIAGKPVGCADCPDKYICGGCRARAYSYFDENIEAPDIGCMRNKLLWERITRQRPAL